MEANRQKSTHRGRKSQFNNCSNPDTLKAPSASIHSCAGATTTRPFASKPAISIRCRTRTAPPSGRDRSPTVFAAHTWMSPPPVRRHRTWAASLAWKPTSERAIADRWATTRPPLRTLRAGAASVSRRRSPVGKRPPAWHSQSVRIQPPWRKHPAPPESSQI